MLDIKLSLLATNELLPGPEQIEVIKKYGSITKPTDLALVTGAFNLNSSNNDLRVGAWTQTRAFKDYVNQIEFYGKAIYEKCYKRRCVIRPVLESSTLCQDIVNNPTKYNVKGSEIEFGIYPQLQLTRNIALAKNYKLEKTENYFVFDKNQDDDKGFCPQIYEEYAYEEQRFIKIKAHTYRRYLQMLNNGQTIYDGQEILLEVLPVKWYIDTYRQRLIAQKGLLSGIRYNDRGYDGNFYQSEIYKYLNEYMLRDLMQSINLGNQQDKNSTLILKK